MVAPARPCRESRDHLRSSLHLRYCRTCRAPVPRFCPRPLFLECRLGRSRTWRLPEDNVETFVAAWKQLATYPSDVLSNREDQFPLKDSGRVEFEDHELQTDERFFCTDPWTYANQRLRARCITVVREHGRIATKRERGSAGVIAVALRQEFRRQIKQFENLRQHFFQQGARSIAPHLLPWVHATCLIHRRAVVGHS